jgi:DNA/RNA-binding domain of Phe-tRNA-synthetase-like protein
MEVSVAIDEHPLLEAACFLVELERPLGECESPEWLVGMLGLEAEAPVERSEEVRAATRDLLRHGGYKPTGRGKPASEYLVRAAGEGKLGSINLVVDACNVASLHSGVPISIVDVELAEAPLRIGIAAEGTRYVFNASGQELDASGLLCLSDADGPCANAVKDAQRTKTHAGTRSALVVVWGSVAHSGRAAEVARWYRELLERAGAATRGVATS